MKKIVATVSLILVCSVLAFSVQAKEKKSKKGKDSYVVIRTSYGDMVLKLYNETPLHRDNFVKLVREGFYDSLLFHRVIKDFMIQGGDPNSKHAVAGQSLGNGEVKGVPRIPAEFNPSLYHKKGALSAARDNNPQKASSNCQFYIVQGRTFSDAELNSMEKRSGLTYTDAQRTMYKTIGGTPHLDNGYTVFGELLHGFSVLDQIAATKTVSERPVQDIRIEMKMLKKYKPQKYKSENIVANNPSKNTPEIVDKKANAKDEVELGQDNE